MSHLNRIWVLTVLLAVGFMLPGTAQAKRFKRYPDDVKKQEEKAKGKQARSTSQRKTPPIQDLDQGKEFAPIPYEPESEPDEPAGLLGDALHGSGGLTVEYIYTGEVFSNMRGGLSTRNATKYQGLFDLAITADLDEMGFFPGGTFFMLMEDSHGKGLSGDFVGDFQGVSNIDSGRPFTQVTEFWWERAICDGFFRARIGKQDTSAEFAVVDLGGDFLNGSFGVHHNIPMAAWPDAAMAVVTFFELTENWNVKVGVFDGAADGRTWGFSGTGDIFSIYELKGEWALLCGRLPGDFHIGMWHHNGSFDFIDGSPGTLVGNHGLYMGFDQMIYKESCDVDNDQGLGIFGQYAWSPEDRHEVPAYVGGGLVYKGLLPRRDDDMFGLGIVTVFVSDQLQLPEDNESAIEMYYKIQLSPYTMLQPDFQYITNPSADARNAFVFGLRFEVVL